MRKPFVAGNWKMNKTVTQASVLVQELLPGLQAVPEVETVLCPPFPAIMVLSAQLANTRIGLGAQNLHWEASRLVHRICISNQKAPLPVK
jgi:triosephosphate isomerase